MTSACGVISNDKVRLYWSYSSGFGSKNLRIITLKCNFNGISEHYSYLNGYDLRLGPSCLGTYVQNRRKQRKLRKDSRVAHPSRDCSLCLRLTYG